MARSWGAVGVVGDSRDSVFLWLDRSWQGAALSLIAAASGPSVEIVLVHLGAFRHLQPDVLGIPMWLPALYLASGPTFGQFARRVVEASRVR